MKYRPDIAEVVERYKEFYYSQKPGHVLIQVWISSSGKTQQIRLDKLDFATRNEEYLNILVDNYEKQLIFRIGLDDDYIPCISAHYGIGPHSAFVAGKPIFGESTSWIQQVVNDWSDLDKLELSQDNFWFRKICEADRILRERAEGKFVVACYTSLSPLDLANALRGNALFTDFYEHESEVHRLLNFCTRAIIWLEEKQQKILPSVCEGRCIWNNWVPGKALFMGEDTCTLCSVPFYKKFGREYTQKVIDHFGGAYIHTHSCGLHVIPEICKLKNIWALEVSEDPNTVRPIDVLEELIEKSNGVPLRIQCSPQELRDKMHIARIGKVIFDTKANDIKEANDIVKFVRENSR